MPKWALYMWQRETISKEQLLSHVLVLRMFPSWAPLSHSKGPKAEGELSQILHRNGQ